jgi:RNA polymerase-binding transcription factor DksA
METELAHPDAPHDQAPVADRPSPGIAAASEVGETSSPEASIDAVEQVLDEVERALGRLDDGTYGHCDACGEPIDDTRLADAPIRQSCDDCAAPVSG